MLEEQLVISGEDEHFFAVFYGGKADENISPQGREIAASYFSPISQKQGCAEAPQKFPVVCSCSCGCQCIFN